MRMAESAVELRRHALPRKGIARRGVEQRWNCEALHRNSIDVLRVGKDVP